MPDALDSRIDRLYGLPLDEFTAARNELAKELEGDDRARVKGLKKPTRAAGAINRAARSGKRDVKRLLDATADLADAQRALLEGGDRRALRKATDREREAVDKLMERVAAKLEEDGGAGEAMLERARGTLHAVAIDDELRGQLEAGRVVEDHTAVGLGGLGAAAPASGGRAGRGKASAAARKKRDAARGRLKEVTKELDDAERRLRRAEGELTEARDRLDAAESSASQARRERDKAAKAREKAEAAADHA